MNKNNKNNENVALMIGVDGSPIFLTSKNPKVWGSMYWSSLFMHASRYPNNPTKQKKEQTKQLLIDFGNDLPCSLCRISFTELMYRFPIESYLTCKRKFIIYLYLIRDSVNRKLIIQERKELQRYLEQLSGDLSEKDRQFFKDRILYTKPSPPLKIILKRWL